MQATVEITDDAYFTALLVLTRVSVLSLSFLWGIGRRKHLRQAQRARARRDNRLTAIALSKQFDILQLIGRILDFVILNHVHLNLQLKIKMWRF